MQRVEQPAGLISILTDPTADHGDRADAAMDLGEYEEPAAEAALLVVALNHNEDSDIADHAGQSLWEIWSRRGKSEPELIARLHP
jgi:hypothetical protein